MNVSVWKCEDFIVILEYFFAYIKQRNETLRTEV